MTKIDDKQLARTHVVVVTMTDGTVRREGPVPQDVARAQAASWRKSGKARSAQVVPFAPASKKGGGK